MAKNLSPFENLAHLLSGRPGRRMACNLEQLADFVSDELAGLPVDKLYPRLAAHLDRCPRCRQEYEELSIMTARSIYD